MSVVITLVNHVVLRNNAADKTHSVSSPELETCQTGLECVLSLGRLVHPLTNHSSVFSHVSGQSTNQNTDLPV